MKKLPESRFNKTIFIPWLTAFIAILYAGMFVWFQNALHVGLAEFLIRDYSFQYAQWREAPIRFLPTLFSYTFLHADEYHFISNLIFFCLLGFSVEKIAGRLFLVTLYIVGGMCGAVAQGFLNPMTNGLIGASAAISALAGMFMVLAPSHFSFRTYGFMFVMIAFWYIGEWRTQFILPLEDLPYQQAIAHGAHLGGFACGVLAGGLFLAKSRYPKA